MHSLSRLGVRLIDSQNEGLMVQHSSESSLLFYVKSKQHLDSILMELKESVPGKFVEVFSEGGDVLLRY